MSTTAQTERYLDALTIRLAPSMRADLERMAIEQERSIGSVVRRALRCAIEETTPGT